jgi:hypothetical protein
MSRGLDYGDVSRFAGSFWGEDSLQVSVDVLPVPDAREA